MTNLKDILRDADPLRDEPDRLETQRGRLRQAVLTAAASESGVRASTWSRGAVAIVATAVLIAAGIVAVGFQIWSPAGAMLQAAVGFEVRLAEEQPAAGLREARIAGSDRTLYLHQEAIVTNADIARCRVVAGDGPSHFGVAVEFNAEGARKMREATRDHIGRPMAILIDGDVVMAPVLRAPISTSALISGQFTQADAERIVNGIGLR